MSSLPAGQPEPEWELSGDQYELFPLPPGPAQVFRTILGQPDPLPELLAHASDPVQQYEIFPELAAALQPKPLPPEAKVDSSMLAVPLADQGDPQSQAAIAQIPLQPVPLYTPPAIPLPGLSFQTGKWDDQG